MKRKVYAFHPRSDSRGCDLLSGNRNLGTLPIEDPDLVIEYARFFSESLRAQIRVIGGSRGKWSPFWQQWNWLVGGFDGPVKPFNDLTGRQFGFLRVSRYDGTDKHRRRRWLVRCERCGYMKSVLAANLLSGRSKSCGCVAHIQAHARMKALALVSKFVEAGCAGMSYEQAVEELGSDYDKALVTQYFTRVTGEPNR